MIRKTAAPMSVSKNTRKNINPPNSTTVEGSANITFFISYDRNSAFHPLLTKNQPKVTGFIKR
jgi:hypothetical protein